MQNLIQSEQNISKFDRKTVKTPHNLLTIKFL